MKLALRRSRLPLLHFFLVAALTACSGTIGEDPPKNRTGAGGAGGTTGSGTGSGGPGVGGAPTGQGGAGVGGSGAGGMSGAGGTSG
ncbi:MAG TPA: hypothetical protein VK550_15200, partial [Polyangiaceae bacterium]|nr:hypothetical protein [Polyangiaceae bacterium]